MSNIYVIHWKSKVNGRSGRGTKRFPLEEGAILVNELNREYPDIHHELLESDEANPEPGAPSAAHAQAAPQDETDKASREAHAFSE